MLFSVFMYEYQTDIFVEIMLFFITYADIIHIILVVFLSFYLYYKTVATKLRSLTHQLFTYLISSSPLWCRKMGRHEMETINESVETNTDGKFSYI